MSEKGPNLASALNEAQSIIEAAEARAQQLLSKARESYQQGYDEGFADGLEDGKAEAVETAVRMLEDSGAIGDRLAVRAAELALAIAGSVIGEQLAVDPETVKRICIRALQESIIGDSAVIVVHPDDKELLDDVADELRRISGGAAVSIEASEKMSRGGCVVRSDFGEVDAQIESLLSVISSRLGIQVEIEEEEE